MIAVLILVFVLGYLGIVFEKAIGIDKSAIALLTGVVLWTILALESSLSSGNLNAALMQHVGEIAGILFFLMAAMTMVELVDAYGGFEIISNLIKTNKLHYLLWLVCITTFFLSAILDNLTTTIIMITLLRKLLPEGKERMLFVGLIVIAANAGGAWSPIGDVTTTMLWIGGQVSTFSLIANLFLPSLFALLVPLVFVSFQVKGSVAADTNSEIVPKKDVSKFEKNLIFSIGMLGLAFVPIFKNFTGLPPFMGILFSLGLLWAVAEFIQNKKDFDFKNENSVLNILSKIDMATILFFLGILLAVAALSESGVLAQTAVFLDTSIGKESIIVTIIGLLSAIVDNVPLVAAAIGMYSLDTYAMDHSFWTLLAFSAGTGGSLLIIGSAAGVAAMGMEKIDFFWYFKKISGLAVLGYFAGIVFYLFQSSLL
jgi:Na+/H+ antiporter NhaD/arsenite permease-like protein